MNLYKITFIHYSQKDSKEGIETYLLAENDKEVYNYIEKEYYYGCWVDEEKENKMCSIYGDEYHIMGKETYKEKIIRIKGEINDEDYDICDLYYGLTLRGWELVKENINIDFTKFIELGIVNESKRQKW